MPIQPRMRSLLLLLLVLLSTALGRAQQRHALVQLEDGKVLEGAVVALDLTSLQLDVGNEVVIVPTAKIRSCRFREEGGAASGEPAAGAPVDEHGQAPAEAPRKPPAAEAPRALPAAGPTEPSEVLAAAALDPESLPHDLRNRSLLRARIEALDETYPWLCPAAPSQWFSLGFLMFTVLTLIVHLSARVCGADQVGLGRCAAIAAWYLVSGFAQVALVPTLDVTTVVMLIGNTAMALFWLRTLFGLPRANAVLGFAVQLGFLLLAYGALELADSLLKSVGNAHL